MSNKENLECFNNPKVEQIPIMSLDEKISIFFKDQSTKDNDIVELCKKKAEERDHNAMLWLARMYRDGLGVSKNKSAALEWYKKSKNHNIFSEFELLAMLSVQKHNFKDIPEGLKIDTRKKEKLFVYEFDNKCMNLLVYLFPFTHYKVVGYSYKDKLQPGFHQDCNDYDKILIANICDSTIIRAELISRGISAEKIITVCEYPDRDKFDGDAIVCNFSDKSFEKKAWVVVPGRHGGLLWHFNFFKTFKGEILSECDYIADTQNHFSMLIGIDDIGYYNPWDYFFKPLSSRSLEEAYCSNGTIISSWVPKKESRVSSYNIHHELSDIIIQKVNTELKKFIDKKKILGVIVRGTDFITIQPINHSIPLDEYETIEIVDERIKSLGLTHVYLSTEDQEIYEAFNKHFGGKLITIDQKRFKKEPVLNIDFIDKNILEPFGKLIQQERYLIATHLVTECKLIIRGSGSGSGYVYKSSKIKIIESYTKGNWGRFGDYPLIVCSHNKNHLSITDKDFAGSSVQYLDLNKYTQKEIDRGVDLKKVHTYLKAGINYVCSFSAEDPESLSLSLTLSSDTGKSASFKLKHNDVFTSPFDTVSGNIVLMSNSIHNLSVGIQIEEGILPSDYEPFRYSWTQICVKDVDGNIFAPGDIEYIDFNKGIFSVQNLEHKLDADELKRYDEIICFNDGYLTYHEGRYHGNKGFISKTTFEKNIDPRKVIGSPKQLLRSSDVTLGRMYRDGKGVPQDLDRAADWMRKAVDKGAGWVKNDLFDILLRINTSESMKEMISVATEFADHGDAGAMIRLGRAYRDGKGVPQDLDRAADWMRKAVDKGAGWAKNELFDILWNIDTLESYEEMISVATEFADHGDAGAMIRLGRAYRDGKGVPQDLDRAADWMRKAVDKGAGWVKNDLFDILLRINTSESMKEMISVATEFADHGDAGAMIRLGRAYRDGKGVPQDLDRAADWMRKAVDKGVGWVKTYLFDILWRINTSESMKEMISVATEFADKGDGSAMGCLGRAYRHGKGVEQDLNKAADWMRKAVDKGAGWAKNELFDILWNIDTLESYEEMISVATEFADHGDAGAMIRLGRAYRDGKGVPQDLDRAADWMRKAVDKGAGWVKNDLFDILLRINTSESMKEMISVATEFADHGDAGAMIRLGRAYRDGKGVPQDLDRAADWMRKAVDKGAGWVKNDLFDILLRINTSESMKEMISVATEFADHGDAGAMIRLGRAYRDGKGVPQDLDRAADWMRKAVDAGIEWAKNDLSKLQRNYL